MADALKKIQAASDKARAKIAAKGFREFAVTLRTLPKTGDPVLGTAGNGPPDDLPLTPPPKVEAVSLRAVEHGAGLIQTGDVRLTQVSRSTSFEARINDPKTIWLIEGPGLSGEFTRIDGVEPIAKNTEWIVTLRPIPKKRGAGP